MTQQDEKLTWDDLFIADVTQEEFAIWIANWQWLLQGPISPIFVTRFGDWYFLRPDGSVNCLDVVEFTETRVADSEEEFRAMVNTNDFKESRLFLSLLLKYRGQGYKAVGRQAIAFAPHPALVDSLDKCKIMVMDMKIWQAICGQIGQKLSDVA